MAEVLKVKLSNSPEETWGNSILYRLALKLGYTPEPGANGAQTIVVDPDEVLDEVERLISTMDEAMTILEAGRQAGVARRALTVLRGGS